MGPTDDVHRAGGRHLTFVRAAVLTVTLLAGLVVPVLPGAPGGRSSVEAIESLPSCGATIAKRFGGGNWKCTFSDYFSGTRLDRSIWTPLTAADSPAVKQECRIDSGQTVRVANGTLRLTVRKLKEPMVCPSPWGAFQTRFIAGGVSSRYGFSQTRGRFEVRARFPAAKVQGLHSAIWMWPKELSYGKYSGEIDIAEFRTGRPNLVVPTLHYYDDGTAGRKSAWDCRVSKPEAFHTYTLEWTDKVMIFFYDGKPCLYHEWRPAAPQVRPQPFDHPFFMILNQSLGINNNAYDGRASLPATMQVDYVRVWS